MWKVVFFSQHGVQHIGKQDIYHGNCQRMAVLFGYHANMLFGAELLVFQVFLSCYKFWSTHFAQSFGTGTPLTVQLLKLSRMILEGSDERSPG